MATSIILTEANRLDLLTKDWPSFIAFYGDHVVDCLGVEVLCLFEACVLLEEWGCFAEVIE